MDFQESLFFYSLPPLLFLNYLVEFKRNRLQLTPLNFFFQGILVSLFFFSTILSLNPGSSYYYLWSFVTILLIVNLANSYISNLNQFFSIIIVISVLYSLTLITSKLGLIHLPTKGLGDNFILQVWGHSYLGNFLLLPITISFHRLINSKKLSYLILLTTFIVALFLSQSRSGVVGVAVAIFFVPTINVLQKKIKTILIVTTTALLGLLILFSSTPHALYKSADGSRPVFWRQAVNGVLQSPIFGNGPSTFKLINRQFKKPHEAITNTTHNSVLEFLTNNGLIFTSIFLLYIGWGLKYQYFSQPLLFCMGAGLFISSLLDSFLSFPGFLVIFLIITTYHSPIYYTISKTNSAHTTISLAIISLLIFCLSLFKTGSDIAYWRQNYSLSAKLDPFNLNSLLQLHDKDSIKKMVRIFPKEETAMISAIKYTHLPESIPYFNSLFITNPQGDPAYYYQLGQYYLDVYNFNELEKILKNFDYQFSDKKEVFPQVDIAKLFYHLAVNKWSMGENTKAVEMAKKSIYYSGGWSQFHIELANIYWHTNQKDLALSQLTTQCHLNPPSIAACDNYLSENKGKFITPGTIGLQESIDSIGK